MHREAHVDLNGLSIELADTAVGHDLQGREMDILKEHFVFVRRSTEFRSNDVFQRFLRLFQIGAHVHRQRCCGACLRRSTEMIDRETRRTMTNIVRAKEREHRFDQPDVHFHRELLDEDFEVLELGQRGVSIRRLNNTQLDEWLLH